MAHGQRSPLPSALLDGGGLLAGLRFASLEFAATAVRAQELGIGVAQGHALRHRVFAAMQAVVVFDEAAVLRVPLSFTASGFLRSRLKMPLDTILPCALRML